MISDAGLRKAGSAVVCADGTLSHAGGFQGACSHHGGISADTVRTAAPSAASVPVRIPTRSTRNSRLLPSAPDGNARVPACSTRNLCVAFVVSCAVLVAAN
jgi:hypothetical protein